MKAMHPHFMVLQNTESVNILQIKMPFLSPNDE